MDIEQTDVEALKAKLREDIAPSKDDTRLPLKGLPKAVRDVRVARLKTRMYRQIVLRKSRAGESHYKRKRLRRNEKRHKYERPGQLEYKRKLYANPETKYREVWRRNWKPYISEKLLAECMSKDEYVQLMRYVPERAYELAEGVITDSKRKNIAKFLIQNRLLVNSYPHESKEPINNLFYKIVRLDTSKSFVLDNILVIDLYTNLVLYKPKHLRATYKS